MGIELRNLRYDEASESYVRPYCASCFMTIRGTAVEVEEGGTVHSEPTCLISWGGLSASQRLHRIKETNALSNRRLWRQSPQGPGPYWARLKGCDMLRKVNVLFVDGEPIVTFCGRPLSPVERDNHEFQKKV